MNSSNVSTRKMPTHLQSIENGSLPSRIQTEHEDAHVLFFTPSYKWCYWREERRHRQPHLRLREVKSLQDDKRREGIEWAGRTRRSYIVARHRFGVTRRQPSKLPLSGNANHSPGSLLSVLCLYRYNDHYFDRPLKYVGRRWCCRQES